MANKILRVGFAMGGGVSLGTFSGTALSQALKLLIVYGRDEAEKKPFERVEVDVFSGASAGALSLAAMVRCLAAPDRNMFAAAKDAVEKEFGADLAPLEEPQRQDLYAAQIMQGFQELLWSKEITLGALLKDKTAGLGYKASLLNRGAVDDIAQRHIVAGSGNDFTGKRVLADRVLFACTLTNLTPIIVDASDNFPGKRIGFIGLNDGLRSSTHRDLRVFDLNFKVVVDPKSDFYADRWCLYHTGAPIKNLIGSLTNAEAWAQIAATAIASGAFPFAFEPVVLPRKAFEYGPARWNKMMGRPKGTALDGREMLPLSYVDGGTLNNEPIREAFRLASFIDGHSRAADPAANFQRLIVFVDPNVSPTRPSFRVPGHRTWAPIELGKVALNDGVTVRRLTSLPRALPHLLSLLGAITDESSANEADKINEVHNQFALRDGIRQALFNTLTNTPADADLTELIAFAESRLTERHTDDMIPPGPMTLPGELERICHEEISADANSPFKALQGQAEAFLAAMLAGEPSPDKGLWLRALAFIAVDLILRLEGKLQNASLVSIAPFINLARIEAKQEPDAIVLPGGALSGFAGFMSNVPDEIEHAAARRCAAEFLRACGLVAKNTPLPPADNLELTDEQRAILEKDVKLGLAELADRAAAMVRDARLIDIFPGIDGLISVGLTGYIKSAIKGVDWRAKQEHTCTFRVRVKDEDYELDGEYHDVDSRPVRTADGGWEIIAIAAWDGKGWSGPFVKQNRLDVDRSGLLKDSDYCEIELPDAVMMAAQEFLPNPTFFADVSARPAASPVPRQKWQPLPGVDPLEKSLLG